MTSKIEVLSAAAALSCGVFVFAQLARPQTTAEQVVEQYVRALGGQAAVEKITSRVTKGTCENADWEMKGPFESYAKAPNKYLEVMSFSTEDVYEKGFNGTVGWEWNPHSEVRELSGEALRHLQREASFYHDVRLRELYSTMKLLPAEKIGSRDAHVVEAIPLEGFADKLYFDQATGLLIRRDSQIEIPGGRLINVILYDDYRDVDGVMVPYSTYLSNFESGINIKLVEVKHNISVDDSRFEKPAK